MNQESVYTVTSIRLVSKSSTSIKLQGNDPVIYLNLLLLQQTLLIINSESSFTRFFLFLSPYMVHIQQ